MTGNTPLPTSENYRQWLAALKTRFRQVQIKAAVAVNTELLQFYWELGADIVQRQDGQAWGSGFLERLSQDLRAEFPQVQGFSKRNLEHIRRWFRFWNSEPAIAKQAATQLLAIPWWHNVVIVSKCRSHAGALYYVQQTQPPHCALRNIPCQKRPARRCDFTIMRALARRRGCRRPVFRPVSHVFQAPV